ncbi:hypothetical protein KsCSTR_42310 [Candidatus Kuenenia stuttgartiensis]|uniref:site-specific DNA-methyltransferase (adenine-specific) n=1 Tax=Kuenenia stuttgartiensis TaxID=174633 RepID=A0A6G7GVH3_KUEST|nr:BREX-1 system adenine-specific DNA-methyltransferase PglX [Candidatus Kuenenia stuttgartiensis]QII13610.1 hypothetical protein KsCSTR_42310 [Candidatus Kuenenia stuttgartiensis]
MDKEIRNKIKKMVQDARKALLKEIGELLEGAFGLHKDGTIEDISRLPQIKDDQNAIKAREGFAYFIERETTAGSKKPDAVERLILGLTFTHLNRLVALKLMERRKVIRETVSRGSKSNGFVHYVVDVLKKTDLSQLDDIDIAYQDYILYQCREVAEEIKVLFDPEDLSSYVFPRPRALKAVLEIINNPEIDNIWNDFDETIGWIYQYFTPKENRKRARAESSAPRNSLELAFRNQFYTPRYVVQFLADNTLGRMWYEMMQGETMLAETCEYMGKPRNEVFLQRDEKPAAQADSFQVPFREKKDPRLLKILDPACGSGHFLLYVFNLLMIIYREAYEDKDMGIALQKDYPDKDAFEREIPCLILENNLYGIDIDLRAIQIAALALWLRAQREWVNIRREDRPRIRNAHLVCAEPMPGNQKLFEDFVSTLKPALLGDLVRNVWEKMKLAGEAGSLLQIEQELRTAIQEAKQKWEGPLRPVQVPLFGKSEPRQLSLSLSEIRDEDFFKEAEEKVFSALRDYAEKVKAENHGYSRRLFAEESIRGFQFIEVLQNRFDVVLMNPPFGETSPDTKLLLAKYYPEWNRNLLCAFVHRMLDLTIENGAVGVIFDRTAIVKSTYEDFRKSILIGKNAIFSMADTGKEVLDADVETTTMVFQKNRFQVEHHPAFFFDVRNISTDEKGKRLSAQIETFNHGEKQEGVYVTYPDEFEKLPNFVIGYDIPCFIRRIFIDNKPLENTMGVAGRCGEIKSEMFFRNIWEVDQQAISINGRWCLLYNGGDYSPFYLPTDQVLFWNRREKTYNNIPRNIISHKERLYLNSLCYGKRGDFLDVHKCRGNHVFTVEGFWLDIQKDYEWFALSILNSSLLQTVINYYSGQHKQSGYINLLPIKNDPKYYIRDVLSNFSHNGYCLKSTWYLGDETNYQFEKPWIILWKDTVNSISNILDALIAYEKKADKELEMISAKIDSKTLELYGVIDPEDIAVVERAVERRPKDVLWKETRGYSEEQKKVYHTESLLSFWIGCLFGRWDAVNGSFYDDPLIHDGKIYDLREAMRKKAEALWEKDEIIAEPTKFALSKEEISSCPKLKYPYAIDPDGIIPIDDGHSEDLIKQIEIAAEITFGSEHIDQVIKEIEGILGQDLRTYFTKRFFESHANRYLRKPIYWLLQSPNKKYSIYVYYHKIDHDTLLKIIRNYVEPKINMLAGESKDIKTKAESSEGAEKRRLEKMYAELLDVMMDIVNFKDSINKLVAQGLELNIDDGIAVNIAPFKDIIPWNEVQKYWTNLESGECDWSKLAMKYWPERVKAKCKKDKSLAIAHGYE